MYCTLYHYVHVKIEHPEDGVSCVTGAFSYRVSLESLVTHHPSPCHRAGENYLIYRAADAAVVHSKGLERTVAGFIDL
jgi:hypothetical protein